MASGTFYPVVSGDDCTTKNDTDFYNSVGYLIVGELAGTMAWDSCIRFPNVSISQGAIITSAFVKFTAYENQSVNTCNADCYFNDTDNAVAPTDIAKYNALAVTAAVAWEAIGGWVNGSQYNTPELKTILQDIINRGGWSSGQAVQFIIKDNSSSASARRVASAIDYLSGAEKAELHVTWEDPLPEVAFTFSNPIPAQLTIVYGATECLYLTTTVSGEEEIYTYDTSFYDGYGVPIGSTISGINSGSSVGSSDCLSTHSGIDYNWYVTVTSSGVEDTSPTYTFSNRFLYEGYVTENDNPVNRMVRLYYRNTGELIDSTTSSGGNGYYRLDATANDEHFIVAFDDEAGEDYNSLILDRLLPNEE